MTMKDRWRTLLRLLDAERPPADMRLYVRPPRSSAEEICEEFEADPTGFQKFLLVGARGCGKSTELRQVEHRIADRTTLVSIDLVASGVSPGALSAFDLLYISGLALLRRLHEKKRREELFRELAAAYAGAEQVSALGPTVDEALAGLAGFASATGKAAEAADLATGGVPIASAAFGLVRQGLRLIRKPDESELVMESSPRGRRLQTVCRDIARSLREVYTDKPICVLIDGLEQMNGNADDRFQQVFCYTRLLADTEWMAAIAAPPSTLTNTNSAHSLGYVILPVWGFDDEDLEPLQRVLQHRFDAVDLGSEQYLDRDQLLRIAKESGGLPRYAINMAGSAVRRAVLDSSERFGKVHADEGIRSLGETLGLGLTSEDFEVMKKVQETHRLPRDQGAAKLFANGRILAHRPASGSNVPRFAVHPLLVNDVSGLPSRS